MSERDIILVFGKQGMGKTRWTKAFLRHERRVLIVDPMGEYDGEAPPTLDALIERATAYPIFRLRWPVHTDLDALALIAMHLQRVTLVIEEAQRSLPQSASPLPTAFEDVLYRGRHASVTLVLIAQRAATVHIAARSQWTRLVSFRQTEDADCRWIGGQADIGADELPGLHPGEYYDSNPWRTEKKSLTDQWESVRL